MISDPSESNRPNPANSALESETLEASQEGDGDDDDVVSAACEGTTILG